MKFRTLVALMESLSICLWNKNEAMVFLMFGVALIEHHSVVKLDINLD